MFAKLCTFSRDESGATAIEYGLIAGLISVAAVAALQGMSESLQSMYGVVSTAAGIGAAAGGG